MSIGVLFRAAGVICWALAAFNVRSPVNLTALGLTLFFLPDVMPMGRT